MAHYSGPTSADMFYDTYDTCRAYVDTFVSTFVYLYARMARCGTLVCACGRVCIFVDVCAHMCGCVCIYMTRVGLVLKRS